MKYYARTRFISSFPTRGITYSVFVLQGQIENQHVAVLPFGGKQS